MIIPWPSWVMWLFVVWIIVNIGWILYQFKMRKKADGMFNLNSIQAVCVIAQLTAQNQALRSNLATKGTKAFEGVKSETMGVNLEKPPPTSKAGPGRIDKSK